AKTDSNAAVMTALSTAITTLTTNMTTLSNNSIEMQTGARKRDQQMDLIIKAMDSNAAAADEQNKKLDAINKGLVTQWNEHSDANGVQAQRTRENTNENAER